MFLAFSIYFQQVSILIYLKLRFNLLLLRLGSLASKSIFVIEFACANLALETSAAKVLNSGVVISYHDYDQ